jgi:ubiquinol-cytochrome c reductase cytochrome c subunit
VKKLIRRRRHPLASFLLLAFALLAVGGFYAAVAPAQTAQATNAKSQAIKEGRELYLKGCSSCHGLNLEGTDSGPTVLGVGAAAVDFQVGTGRMPLAEANVQAARKQPVYNEQETAALAAYIASISDGPGIPGPELLNYERDGSTSEGGDLFRTNCAMCHNFAGQGGALTQGKYAPTVMGVSPKHIYEAMVTGPQSMPVFADTTLPPDQKLSIIKWIKFVEAEKNIGGAALGRVGPVTEGLFSWVVGLGLLIGAAVWLGAKAK